MHIHTESGQMLLGLRRRRWLRTSQSPGRSRTALHQLDQLNKMAQSTRRSSHGVAQSLFQSGYANVWKRCFKVRHHSLSFISGKMSPLNKRASRGLRHPPATGKPNDHIEDWVPPFSAPKLSMLFLPISKSSPTSTLKHTLLRDL